MNLATWFMNSGRIVTCGIGKLWASFLYFIHLFCQGGGKNIWWILGLLGKVPFLLPHLKTWPISSFSKSHSFRILCHGLETTLLGAQIFLVMIPLKVFPFYWYLQVRKFRYGSLVSKAWRGSMGDKGHRLGWEKNVIPNFS